MVVDAIDRYDRQIRIAGWGRRGQRKLARSSLFVAGAGGLGSCSAILLASAGIGRLRIVDKDVVELTNLNRQTLHWEADVGVPKAESARAKLVAINSGVRTEALKAEINEDSVDELLGGMDGIIDGLDNFETRYLLNREAVERGIPFFHGSVYGLEGRATTVLAGRSPCLRCIYESAPKPGIFPVTGPVPSLVGSVQALESIKYLLDLGELLLGRMLVFDGQDLTFREIQIRRSPICPVCGKRRSSA